MADGQSIRITQNKQKMKIPTCLCGLARGFHHELKCWSCSCFPWQHSSDEDHNVEVDSAEEEIRRKREEFEERIRLLNEEEDRKIEEERERKVKFLRLIFLTKIKFCHFKVKRDRKGARAEKRMHK